MVLRHWIKFENLGLQSLLAREIPSSNLLFFTCPMFDMHFRSDLKVEEKSAKISDEMMKYSKCITHPVHHQSVI